MQSDMFDFPVEIKKVDCPFSTKFNEKEFRELLEDFSEVPKSQIQNDVCEFYEFTRTGFGISHPAYVLFVPTKGHFSIKPVAYSPPIILSLKKPPIDSANYHRMRIQHLIHSLGEHFPETIILESKSEEFLIILQKFLFHPICQFNNTQQISQLIEILWLASQAHILLDYNHNHWLISKLNFLYYVDIDYIGQSYLDYNKCLFENLNQSMVFFTPENITLIPQALKDFSKRGENQAKFIEDFKKGAMRLIESWGDKERLSEKNKRKLVILSEVVQS
ncbi:MAG: hypothetical protein ACFE9L_19165 [Candidatus Hodarchaeota archaeon]